MMSGVMTPQEKIDIRRFIRKNAADKINVGGREYPLPNLFEREQKTIASMVFSGP
jgi:hypothetical protein